MQTNVQEGPIVRIAAEDLSGMEDRLVIGINDGGVLGVRLPNNVNEIPLYLLLDGKDADNDNVEVEPIYPGKSYRIKLLSTCNPGDILVLATVDGTSDGMVMVCPSTAGTYRGIAVAEEAGVDGQTVLCRPALIGNIVVT
jgi:hypothetical protein